jgi:hypothetical protein
LAAIAMMTERRSAPDAPAKFETDQPDVER